MHTDPDQSVRKTWLKKNQSVSIGGVPPAQTNPAPAPRNTRYGRYGFWYRHLLPVFVYRQKKDAAACGTTAKALRSLSQ